MKNIFILLFVFIFSFQFGFSQTFDSSILNQYFNALDSNQRFMGSVAISENGKIIYTNQIGFTDVANQIKPNVYTTYRIGSISKTFTAVLIFKAVEEKKIKLSDKLNKFFPQIKNSKIINISNLLNHSSGIHNFTNDEDYLTYNTQKNSEKELLQIFTKMPSDFYPGTKAEYSNTNYVLLSFILQKLYKKSYAELLKEKITEPLGLNHTYFGKPISIERNESYSYTYAGKWVKEYETDMSVPMGAGGIVSNPVDLTRFADALFNGKLISKENLQNMKTLEYDFGMGLFKVPFYKKVGYGHTGGIDGFSSVLYHFDDNDVSVALTSNGTNYNNNDIIVAMLSAVYNVPYEIPDFKTVALKSEDLDKFLGVYSSSEVPLKITITKNENVLIAQATGQASFSLTAESQNVFSFKQAGIILEFDTANKTMILKQGGGSYKFIKE